MIGHELHRSGSFWSFLLSIDKDLAGVMFSIGNPETGFDKVVLINAAWGLARTSFKARSIPTSMRCSSRSYRKNC